MSHLERTFRRQSDLIHQRMAEDVDFRRLCTDYERVAGTIHYLATLMALPREGLQRQIEQESHLLRELEMEIRAFLELDEKSR